MPRSTELSTPVKPTEGEDLFDDRRLARVVRFLRERNLWHEEMTLEAHRQPERWIKMKSGIEAIQPAMAVFIIMSPSTSPRMRREGKQIMSHAVTRFSDWREADQEARHSSDEADPAVRIFIRLAQEHMRARDAYDGLN